jgi:hypothetical protein
MTFRKSILLLIGLSMLAALVACGSSNHTTTTPPPTITISLSAFTGPLAVNSQTPITATTTDTAGVNWSVTCASTSGVCGTFTSSQTATTVANNYIAPPIPTTGVVITATSVTTSSVTASTSPAVAITGATLADGSYVFSLAGVNANGNGLGKPGNYYVAGEFTIAGGVITQGEQDFVDLLHDQFDAINGTTAPGTGASTITTNPDGNLQITLVTCAGTISCASADTNVGLGGTETLNGSILPLSTTGRAFITEFDASGSASGELDPQDLTAAATAPANGYAFVVSGLDHIPGSAPAPLAIGGVINVDSPGKISGTGSVFDANDDFSGPQFAGQKLANTSGVSGPDGFGRVKFTLVTTTAHFSTIVLAGYIVDANRIQLAETADPYSGTLGGVAYSQSNGAVTTGGFTTGNVAGTYVVGMSGADTNNPVLQVANQLSLAAGAVTGFVDYNDIATSSGMAAAPATSPDAVTAATYTVDNAGAGDITISNINDGTGAGSGDLAGIGYNLQLYLDGNGHALAISMDTSDAIAGAGFAQSGSVPFAATAFSGPYGLDVTGIDVNFAGELDGVGPVSATAGTFAGTVDLNWLSTATTYPATAVNGTYVATGTGASNGVFTGNITGVDAATCITVGIPSCNVDNFSYYLIDATGDNIAIETDENQLTLGFFLQQ